jgi:radical SAM-linked protein
MRLRITFSKTEAMRFTSHLDLHRTWERTFRRAGLPLAYTQGFNPHPRINLASALPLGFTGEGEIVDVWLEDNVPLPEIETALVGSVPPGVKISRVQEIDERSPTLQVDLEASEFIVTFLEPVEELSQRLDGLLAAESLPRERRGKKYDLRPLIQEIKPLPEDKQGHLRIFVRLTAHEGSTGRPEEVIAALGVTPESTRVHRTRLLFQNS